MIALHVFVALDVRELIDTYAHRANMPIWAIFEAAIRAGVPDESGIPTGWDLPENTTTRQLRRRRGTPTTAMHVFLAPDVKELIDIYAHRANMPIWAIVEAAMRAGVPDESGIPAGWDLPENNPAALPGINGGGDAVRSSP